MFAYSQPNTKKGKRNIYFKQFLYIYRKNILYKNKTKYINISILIYIKTNKYKFVQMKRKFYFMKLKSIYLY